MSALWLWILQGRVLLAPWPKVGFGRATLSPAVKFLSGPFLPCFTCSLWCMSEWHSMEVNMTPLQPPVALSQVSAARCNCMYVLVCLEKQVAGPTPEAEGHPYLRCIKRVICSGTTEE